MHLDLVSLFDPLDGFKISEIGAGYGGQALHLLKNHQVLKYYIYDLEWPTKLSIKYLQRISSFGSTVVSVGQFKGAEVDLAITNFAFSELNRTVQEQYFSEILIKSKRGYVIFNDIQGENSGSFTAQELAKRIPNSTLLREIPQSFPGNLLVIWGDTEDWEQVSFLSKI